MIKKFVVCFIFYLLMIIPINIFALENDELIVNSNGVEMTLEDYNNLKKYFSDMHIDTLTQDEFDEQMQLDFENVNKTIKYYRTDYNHITNETISTEITEEEYNNGGLDKELNLPRSNYIESNYKWLSLGAGSSYGDAFLCFVAHWKIIPATRSFDVIATRIINLDVINGTQGGKQFYTINGNTSYVNYNFNGTNINNQSNGFGISMNLINDPDLSALELEITSSLEVTNYPAIIYASYQHATSSVTLAESKNYTLSYLGMGDVILFANNSTAAKYDGMGGTDFYIYG
ncbi:MAG: hypothetical protein IKR74_00690 [Bacilli bacterium]|nr:hypothetical protein [Bacilli bacterium]